MTLRNSRWSAKLSALLLASMSLGLASPQMGLANTSSTPPDDDADDRTYILTLETTISTTTEADAAATAAADADAKAKTLTEQAKAKTLAEELASDAVEAADAARLRAAGELYEAKLLAETNATDAQKEAIRATARAETEIESALAALAPIKTAAREARARATTAREARARATTAAVNAVNAANAAKLKADKTAADADADAAEAAAAEVYAAAAKLDQAIQEANAAEAAEAAAVKAEEKQLRETNATITAILAAARAVAIEANNADIAKAAVEEAFAKIQDALSAAGTARSLNAEAISHYTRVQQLTVIPNSARLAAARAVADAAEATTAAAAKLEAALAALAEAKLKAQEAGSTKLTAVLTTAQEKLATAEAKAADEEGKREAAINAILEHGAAKRTADAATKEANAKNATLEKSNRESWNSKRIANKDKAFSFSYNSKEPRITEPNVEFKWKKEDYGASGVVTTPELTKKFQRMDGVEVKHTVLFPQVDPVENSLIDGYDYREYDKEIDVVDSHKIWASVKSNHKRGTTNVRNSDYLVYGSWMYLDKQSGYSEIGSIVQGPEFDHEEGDFRPWDDYTPGAIPSSGKATYYRQNGAGGIYRYDGKYRKFEADVKLTAYFGRPLIKQDDGTFTRVRHDEQQTHMQGCIGCNNSFSILDRNGKTAINTSIELNKGIASSNSLRNVGTIRGNISKNGMSGQWQAKMSKIPHPHNIPGTNQLNPLRRLSRLTAGTFDAEWTHGEGDKAQITGYFVAPATDRDLELGPIQQPDPQ